MPIRQSSAHGGAVQHDPVADHAAVADGDGKAGVGVGHGVVLEARLAAQRDALGVAAQHRARPHVGVVEQLDIADDDRRRVDEDVLAEAGRLVLVGDDGHGAEYTGTAARGQCPLSRARRRAREASATRRPASGASEARRHAAPERAAGHAQPQASARARRAYRAARPQRPRTRLRRGRTPCSDRSPAASRRGRETSRCRRRRPAAARGRAAARRPARPRTRCPERRMRTSQQRRARVVPGEQHGALRAVDVQAADVDVGDVLLGVRHGAQCTCGRAVSHVACSPAPTAASGRSSGVSAAQRFCYCLAPRCGIV